MGNFLISLMVPKLEPIRKYFKDPETTTQLQDLRFIELEDSWGLGMRFVILGSMGIWGALG